MIRNCFVLLRWSPRRGRGTGCAGLLILAVLLGSSRAQQEFINRERQIKAAYLYNFGRYVDWPDAADGMSAETSTHFVVAVLGDESLTEELRKIARHKTLRDKRIVVQQIRQAGEYRACHLLFVAAGQEQELVQTVLEKTKADSILVVSDAFSSALPGVVINFYSDDNKLRFEINMDAARQRKLQISSKLLQAGKLVGGKNVLQR